LTHAGSFTWNVEVAHEPDKPQVIRGEDGVEVMRRTKRPASVKTAQMVELTLVSTLRGG
jgi:hypothetical protein